MSLKPFRTASKNPLKAFRLTRNTKTVTKVFQLIFLRLLVICLRCATPNHASLRTIQSLVRDTEAYVARSLFSGIRLFHAY